MKLPEKLLRQASIGTFIKPDFSPSELDEHPLFELLKTEDRPVEGCLLLEVAALGLRHQAGYLPQKLSYSKSAKLLLSTRDSRISIMNIETTQELIRMLGTGEDIEFLPELCRLAIKNQLYLPHEFAPFLLTAAKQLDSYRIYLRGILSKKVLRLVMQSGKIEWQWVLTTPVPSGIYLSGVRSEREKTLIASISESSSDEINKNCLLHFANYLQPWSEALTLTFLQQILSTQRNLINSTEKLLLLNVIETFAYYAPIEFHHEIIPYLSQPTVDIDIADRIKEIKRIIGLRRKIYESIEGKSNHDMKVNFIS